ncbi:polyhydroxyalkanoate synthesis regulator DNA-binding domain-containing protein [Pseudomonas lini]
MTDTTPRLIKKYPNRRLYDTHTSSHLTLADIRQLVVDKNCLSGGRCQERRGPDAQHLAASDSGSRKRR